ncbi:hypothetical protein [Modestobacter sp. URMC 112]
MSLDEEVQWVPCTRDPFDGLPYLPQYSVTASWGAVVDISAREPSPPLELVASLDGGASGEPAFGQYLACYTFETSQWVLSVGGPDDDLFELQVEEGVLPSDWRGLIRDAADPPTGYGFFSRRPDELGWSLPPVPPGATVTTHAAVAWTPQGDESDVATWYAVPTSAEQLRHASQTPLQARPTS